MRPSVLTRLPVPVEAFGASLLISGGLPRSGLRLVSTIQSDWWMAAEMVFQFGGSPVSTEKPWNCWVLGPFPTVLLI